MSWLPNARRIAVATTASVLVLLTGPPAVHADSRRAAQWPLQALRVAEAQKISTGSSVIVAVIDSGVWAGNPDLAGAVMPGVNLLGDGGDGRQDIDGHGTAVAGIIAARGRSGDRGLLGIAPDAKILPIRPITGPLIVKQAIDYAVANGAKVINMSFLVSDSPGLATAIKAAADADVVLVAGAGNDGQPGFSGEYPAAYSEVIAVGSVDRNGVIAPSSHRGPQLDITAPGVDYPVLDREGTADHNGTGTSFASATVAGAAALIRAKYPDMRATDVVKLLETTAADKGAPGRDDTYGYGELDLMAALTAQPGTGPSSAAPATPPVAAPKDPDDSSGIPPLAVVAIGLGVVVLAAAGVMVAVRRSRRT